ncbi:hypothetical protein [Allokutzneria sp. NRRL B-24872]|uniref:hypothetical protein n=1 Tax=Allokutzneria sp. NRRL B-24872 TaxID=1137961 RepID=UPI00143CF09A|nr:hypothetical protein [Allokutzneria sp. NRRL B-24872]
MVATLALLTACGSVRGEAVAVESTSARTEVKAVAVDLCSKLNWGDLGYPGVGDPKSRPTKTGDIPEWQQSCSWNQQQYNAGYKPPTPPNRDKYPPGIAGDIEAMGGDIALYKSIQENSSWVVVKIAYDPKRKAKESPDQYQEAGRTIYLTWDSSTSVCTANLPWVDGALAIAVADKTKAFGAPCDKAKSLVTLLLQREDRK